jgi:NADH dehydrogenase
MSTEGSETCIVTGAFSYTGSYIARELLARGMRVRTLTNHPERADMFEGQVDARPLAFSDPVQFVESMRGASILYNTYWIRFACKSMTFERAVKNTKILLDAAVEAGVQRVVHVSVTNPDIESDLPYFRGKAEAELAVANSGLSHAILRPALLYGEDGVLINNLAWLMRLFPVFPVPGDGKYRMQPTFIEDFAKLAVACGGETASYVVDVVGPETFSFNELLRLIARCMNRRVLLTHLLPGLALWLSRIPGAVLRDVLLTPDEAKGLSRNLLTSSSIPSCFTRLSDWLKENARCVGRRYINDFARHYR